ncbi:MAG: LysE family translocator [Pseudomonadota bacterium]
MSYETWLAFVLASMIVVLIPGPNIVLTVNYAVRDGRRTGLATIPGVVTGAFLAMSLSLLGAGAVLVTSVYLFTLLKIVGALYLLWLAYSLWTSPVEPLTVDSAREPRSLRALYWQSLLVSALNPKGPAFYLAFVPQFVSPAAPAFAQFAILIATFLAVAALNGLFWLLCASALRNYFRRAWALKVLNRIGASCLFVAGLFTARSAHTP